VGAVRRDLHAVVLLLVGGVLLRLGVTGGYARYVRAGFLPFLLVAAVVLVVVAVASLWQGRVSARVGAGQHGHDRGVDDGHDQHAGGHAHHGHHHGGFDVAWLLVAPMLVLQLLAPQALGSYSASRGGTAVAAATPVSQLPPLAEGDPVRLSVLEYASRAVSDQGRSLTGRQVSLSGFLTPGPHGGWYLTRMVVTCCAADAQPVKVGLAGTVPGPLHANGWIQVVGGYVQQTDKDPVNAATIPYLQVSQVTPIPAPDRQYVS
jgi:putative membrane protein